MRRPKVRAAARHAHGPTRLIAAPTTHPAPMAAGSSPAPAAAGVEGGDQVSAQVNSKWRRGLEPLALRCAGHKGRGLHHPLPLLLLPLLPWAVGREGGCGGGGLTRCPGGGVARCQCAEGGHSGMGPEGRRTRCCVVVCVQSRRAVTTACVPAEGEASAKMRAGWHQAGHPILCSRGVRSMFPCGDSFQMIIVRSGLTQLCK